MRRERSPLAGTTVKIRDDALELGGAEYGVEDWWQNVSGGKSWAHCAGIVACRNYAIRAHKAKLPLDDDVLYGKIGIFGHLVHLSEVEPPERTV